MESNNEYRAVCRKARFEAFYVVVDGSARFDVGADVGEYFSSEAGRVSQVLDMVRAQVRDDALDRLVWQKEGLPW